METMEEIEHRCLRLVEGWLLHFALIPKPKHESFHNIRQEKFQHSGQFLRWAGSICNFVWTVKAAISKGENGTMKFENEQ